ncbi:hypothetical protein, partial [Escherichia coli]
TDGDGSHGSTSKTPSYTKSVSWHHYPKIPLLFAFSRSRKRPAFDVRFLALKSILLIIIRTPFYYFSYYYFTIYRVIKADNLTYF